MGQKVWMIDEETWGASEPSPPAEKWSISPPAPNTMPFFPLAKPPQKSPALAFSLSLILWGSGHLYAGRYRQGWGYLLGMIFFYAATGCMVFFRNRIAAFVGDHALWPPLLMALLIVFPLSALLVWLFNAVDAYQTIAAGRSLKFAGVDHGFGPLLCSLLFPGWGQFLNGQPRKGMFFLLCGSAAVFSAAVLSAALTLWPALGAGTDRFLFEPLLVFALLLLPPSLLTWIAAAHDAWRVSRARQGTTRRGLLAQLRATAMLGLLLAATCLAGAQHLPREFYIAFLEAIRTRMLSSSLSMLPEYIQNIIDVIAH